MKFLTDSRLGSLCLIASTNSCLIARIARKKNITYSRVMQNIQKIPKMSRWSDLIGFDLLNPAFSYTHLRPHFDGQLDAVPAGILYLASWKYGYSDNASARIKIIDCGNFSRYRTLRHKAASESSGEDSGSSLYIDYGWLGLLRLEASRRARRQCLGLLVYSRYHRV